MPIGMHNTPSRGCYEAYQAFKDNKYKLKIENFNALCVNYEWIRAVTGCFRVVAGSLSGQWLTTSIRLSSGGL